MLIDLLGDGHVRVAQDELRIPDRHAEIFEQRRGGMPQMVHGGAAQAGLDPDPFEGSRHVPRVNRLASPGRDHQVCAPVEGRRTTRRGRRTFSVSLSEQDGSNLIEERQVATARFGLDAAGAEVAAEALDLLPDPDDAGGEVNVAPAQPEHFAEA